MDAFAIFEGGGVKALAHVGALLAAEERQVNFVGVAGTSAGAIVAALIAVGYTANEMYNLTVSPRGVLDRDFREFFGSEAWENLKSLASDARERYRKVKKWGTLQGLLAIWHMAWFRYRNGNLVAIFFNELGFFGTEHIVAWLEALLAAKAPSKSGANGRVVFKDVPKPLKIVATNMKDRRIKVFSQDTTPSCPVAEAVAASISIPLLFKPKWLQDEPFLDGGLLSNFPAWLFDDERRQRGPLVPTFGFKLVGPLGTLAAEQPSIVKFLWGLGATILAGDPLLETREVENLHVVPLRAHKHTIDLDLEPDDRDRLYEAGLHDARSFFITRIGPQDPAHMTQVLDFASIKMVRVFEAAGTQLRHLRVNVVLPTTKGRLRVFYTHNMDNDPDDQLEFDIGSGACGQCYQLHQSVICDLEDAKRTFRAAWKMNKYQQAMVRQCLKSLLCVPIFNLNKYNPSLANLDNPLLGVLSFDSDHDLLVPFGRTEIESEAMKMAAFVGRELTR